MTDWTATAEDNVVHPAAEYQGTFDHTELSKEPSQWGD
jgi:hypothetical protein